MIKNPEFIRPYLFPFTFDLLPDPGAGNFAGGSSDMRGHAVNKRRRALLFLFAVLILSLAAIPPNIGGLRSSILTVYSYGEGGVRSMGSGWMISDHEAVTCFHVIEGAQRVEMMTDDHRMVRVTGIEAADKEGDIAILVIPPQPGAEPLPLAAGRAKVGERVYVVATPHGLSSSLGQEPIPSSTQIVGINQVHTPITVGAVSALGNKDGIAMVQFTAPITHGCSGAPLVNAQGEVMAVVQSMEGDGLYFGVDVDRVRKNLASPPPAPRPRPTPADPGRSNNDFFERASGGSSLSPARPNTRPIPRPDPHTETRPRPGGQPSTRPRPQTPRSQTPPEDSGTIYERK
jgi:hypothetical protein